METKVVCVISAPLAKQFQNIEKFIKNLPLPLVKQTDNPTPNTSHWFSQCFFIWLVGMLKQTEQSFDSTTITLLKESTLQLYLHINLK